MNRRDLVNKRYWWLIKVVNKNKYSIGAEIGCAKGRTTYRLLQNCRHLRLYAVDLWKPVPKNIGGGSFYYDWDFKGIKKTFDKAVAAYYRRLTVLKGVSWEMAKKVKNNSLDFVFIDADHEYESVKKDILAWNPKLKPGGMMSGHDCNHPGVLKAINEIVPNWEEVGIDNCWKAKKEEICIK